MCIYDGFILISYCYIWLQGVTIADINEVTGAEAFQSIAKEFGSTKTIFIKTDVTKVDEVEKAFEKTVHTFQNIDILINSAGILNDAEWEKEVAVNVVSSFSGLNNFNKIYFSYKFYFTVSQIYLNYF